MSKNNFSKSSLEKRLSQLLELRETIYQKKKIVNREISEVKKLLEDYEKLENLRHLSTKLEKLK